MKTRIVRADFVHAVALPGMGGAHSHIQVRKDGRDTGYSLDQVGDVLIVGHGQMRSPDSDTAASLLVPMTNVISIVEAAVVEPVVAVAKVASK